MAVFPGTLSDEERDYLVRLLERRHVELLHELHHAVTRRFKEGLREEIALTEQLKGALEPAHA